MLICIYYTIPNISDVIKSEGIPSGSDQFVRFLSFINELLLIGSNGIVDMVIIVDFQKLF